MSLRLNCQLAAGTRIRDRGSASHTAHPPGCWLEASAAASTCFSTRLPQTWQLASPKASDPREREQEAPASTETCPRFCYILLVTPTNSDTMREGTTQKCVILDAGYDTRSHSNIGCKLRWLSKLLCAYLLQMQAAVSAQHERSFQCLSHGAISSTS